MLKPESGDGRHIARSLCPSAQIQFSVSVFTADVCLTTLFVFIPTAAAASALFGGDGKKMFSDDEEDNCLDLVTNELTNGDTRGGVLR